VGPLTGLDIVKNPASSGNLCRGGVDTLAMCCYLVDTHLHFEFVILCLKGVFSYFTEFSLGAVLYRKS